MSRELPRYGYGRDGGLLQGFDEYGRVVTPWSVGGVACTECGAVEWMCDEDGIPSDPHPARIDAARRAATERWLEACDG